MTTNGHVSGFDHDDGSTSVYNAKSVSEIRAALAELHNKEAVVTSQLDTLVNAQKDLQRELGRLDLFRANATTQASKVRAVSNGMLSDAAENAKRISNSVKRLDLEQERLKATLTVVEQVGELKACVLGVSGSMGAAQDWETAASYLSRASKIPAAVINGPFAARIVPTAEVPDAPAVTLENASESLCGLFLREFDKAVKENDGATITRFFKLFPLINRSDVGLDVYGRYVCQGVAARARTNLNAGTGGNQSKDGFFYANAMTKLFEHIAQIIEGHGGLVERHYGPGKMARVVERLQVEADLQGGIILDTWADERRIDRQLTDIKSYAFTFLVQSFMPAQRGSTGTPRAGSPAPGRSSEDDSVDMKQVDAVLNEMTSMLSKWSLYTRFITEKCHDPAAGDEPSVPAFLLNSSLMRKVQDRLLTPFNIMTTFFFRRSVEKAFQLDEQPPDLSLNPHKRFNSNPPHVTSAIEDIMYIVNKVLQQSLATSQKQLISNVIPTLGRILGSDFIGMEQRKMRDESYPKAAIQGQLPPESTIVSFLVLVNNLDVARDYVDQIARARLEPAAGSPHRPLDELFPVPGEAEAVAMTLTAFCGVFSEKTNELISDGVNVIFHNVMKPRLRPILMDAFRDTDYQLTREQLQELAQEMDAADDTEGISDEVRMRFQLGWDALTKPIGRLMTERTFDQLLTTVVTYLSKMIEKRLWTYQGRVNDVGAARLEHDINEIVKVVVKGQKYSFRESFLRCSQICMIMNMDEEEWEELQNSGGDVADKLKLEERVRARNMVVNGAD
ncbi:Golgi transport complex subunit 4 [Cladophialophora chaetospira]|uniref:Conserved oligomeric Golgi complex subunit 4 n=1 Tax=Cladophialophora chaetospira TaxID=386627 RepID=A0AA38X227_9EURO|nr:Golgi transport complex subunit 4 [Cladophialophora chaetospira]